MSNVQIVAEISTGHQRTGIDEITGFNGLLFLQLRWSI
jgi:hypothetical protein